MKQHNTGWNVAAESQAAQGPNPFDLDQGKQRRS